MQPKTTKTAELEASFTSLAERWQRETAFDSVGKRTVEHPAYQKIIGMGDSALPLIFREMEQKGGHWFHALREITGQTRYLRKCGARWKDMQRAWLEWAQHRDIGGRCVRMR